MKKLISIQIYFVFFHLLIFFHHHHVDCRDWFVSPTALFSGSGTITDPIELGVLFRDIPVYVLPNETIYLREGVYHGRYVPRNQGEEDKPIIVKPYQKEKVIIEGMGRKMIMKDVEQGNNDDMIIIEIDHATGIINNMVFIIEKYTEKEELIEMDSVIDEYHIRVKRICNGICPAHKKGEEMTIFNLGYSYLQPGGSHIWFMGLELMGDMNNQPRNISWLDDQNGADASAIAGYCFKCKYINNIIHDCGSAAVFDHGSGSEYSGNIIYYNGWDHTDRGNIKKIYDNIMFKQFSLSMKTFGNIDDDLDNFHYEGNIMFKSGQPSIHGYTWNFLIGGGRVANHQTILNNYCYQPIHAIYGSNDFGQDLGINDADINDNVFTSSTALNLDPHTNVRMERNIIYGNTYGFNHGSYPTNTYYPKSNRPTGKWIYVRKIKYIDRANIVIYNWDLSKFVDVNVSSVLNVGDKFVLKDVEDIFGDSIQEGYFDGSLISLPMALSTVTPILGLISGSIEHSDEEFGCFVLYFNDEAVFTKNYYDKEKYQRRIDFLKIFLPVLCSLLLILLLIVIILITLIVIIKMRKKAGKKLIQVKSMNEIGPVSESVMEESLVTSKDY